MKPKNKYEEVTTEQSTSIKEIETKFRIHKILTYILIVLAIVITLSNLKLTLDNEALKKEKNEIIESLTIPYDVLKEDR